MSSLCKVKFGISYLGSTKFRETSDISAIDVEFGKKKKVFATLNQTAQVATQYPLFQPNCEEKDPSSEELRERRFETISMPPSLAKTMKLSARVLSLSQNQAEQTDMPVFFPAIPKFEEGKCYRIELVQQENGYLFGNFTETSAEELSGIGKPFSLT